MSAPRLMSTWSWNRLSGVRFSWKMMTTCLILPGAGGGGVAPEFWPLQLLKIIKDETTHRDEPRSSEAAGFCISNPSGLEVSRFRGARSRRSPTFEHRARSKVASKERIVCPNPMIGKWELVVGAGGDFGAAGGWEGHFLVFVLQLVQLVVDPALSEQLLVGAHFADFTLVHDND